MISLCHYTIRLLTPGFLGDAEQNGRWRTPPFKALLRQWWRVAYAADHRFSVDMEAMRREEGQLFGNTWLTRRENHREVTAHCKSLLRLRLDRWMEGNLTKAQWPADSPVRHPEVSNRRGEPVPVGSSLYLGYGPLTYDNQRRTTTLRSNAAIQVGDEAKLSVVWPTQHPSSDIQQMLDDNNHRQRIERALWLMDRYGTVGGRSRNGWGSFTLIPINGTSALRGAIPVRGWKDALNLDWPHAIGQDDKGPLIWQTAKAYDDWTTLMRDLAIIKIGLRTQFIFTSGNNTLQPESRHWLSYPVTNHSVRSWGNNARLPNTLRFKIRSDMADPKKLRGVIFHMPCLPPPEFSPDPSAIEAVWRTVHTLLDELCKPSNNRTYSRIKDQDRRHKLKAELDKVTLERIPE
ncbi:MAG: hypothetical protein D6690_06125 [Nitrospirae bacterium]|nr:MAG: hypothetical protein D6690_06125 [Nitrospirota bacterium]